MPRSIDPTRSKEGDSPVEFNKVGLASSLSEVKSAISFFEQDHAIIDRNKQKMGSFFMVHVLFKEAKQDNECFYSIKPELCKY